MEYNMSQKLKDKLTELRLLLRSVPALTMTVFVLSVFSMNLLANKSITLPFDWLALDCGILVSWAAFLIMDLLTAHFGPRAATALSVVAILINLAVSFIFALASGIDGVWSAAGGQFMSERNAALNATFGGTWYIILGSTVAFAIAAVINNFSNFAVGKLFRKKPDGMGAYIIRSYISTAVGQFCDNLIFALIVSHFFFGWTLTQCITCALTGMLAELICQLIFSVFGYRIKQRWQKNKVGEEYLEYIKKENAVK